MSQYQNTRPHCSFVLLAEFDIIEGAQLKYQFPQPLGVDESVLAMSMLPDGAETQLDDWTVFFLNQTKWNRIEPVVGLHDEDDEELEPDQDQDDEAEGEWGYEDENEEEVEAGGEDRKGKKRRKKKKDELLCVLNLVRTKHDKTLDRGARVLALAICTRHPFIQIFKPVLLMALDDYLSHPSQDVLARLFDAVNAIDFSGAPVLSRDEKLVMRLSERKDIFAEKHTAIAPNIATTNATPIPPIPAELPADTTADVSFGSAVWVDEDLDLDTSTTTAVPTATATTTTRERSSTDASAASSSSNSSHLHLPRLPITRAGSSYASSSIPPDTHFFNTTVEYNGHKLPIKMPLSTFPEEVGDYSLITLIRVFSQSDASSSSSSSSSNPSGPSSGPIHPHLHTAGPQTHPILLIFNALLTNKNIIFLGHRRPAGEVSMFVLTACALGSGCGAILRGFIERAFPYANLNNRDEWEGVRGYIAGVTNPIFENSRSWDLLCDIGTGTVVVSKDIWSRWPVGPLPPMHPHPSITSSLGAGGTSSSSGSSLGLIAPLLTRTGTLKAEALMPSTGSDDSHSYSHDGPSIGISSGGAGATLGVPIQMNAKGDSSSVALKLAMENSADNLFIEDIKLSIEYHYGESLVRVRFMEYVMRFVRLASRWEEEITPAPSTLPTNGIAGGSGEKGGVSRLSDEKEREREKEKGDLSGGTSGENDLSSALRSSRTKIGYPSVGFSISSGGFGTLGSGLVFTDETLGLKELIMNAHRIEGWRSGGPAGKGSSSSYGYCVQDFANHLRTSPIRTFDVVHQIFRLRHVHYSPSSSSNPSSNSNSSSNPNTNNNNNNNNTSSSSSGKGSLGSGSGGGGGMSDAEAYAIFRSLADGVKTYEQVVELLSHLTPHTGFLLPLAFGLFHQNVGVRDATVELFDTLRGYDVGIIFLQSLNHFQRFAYVRLAHAREAKKMYEVQQHGQNYQPQLPQGPSHPNHRKSIHQQQQGGYAASHSSHTSNASHAQPPPYPGPPPPVYSNAQGVVVGGSAGGGGRSHSNSTASLGFSLGSSYGSGSVISTGSSSYGSGESRLNGTY